MKPVIVVENVSKKFSRKINAHLNYGIRDLMTEILGRSRNTQLRQDEFIAVNDLSFALYPGDSFALIGRNGCGKTTTLNMLNGTLKPDAGNIITDGRVQALISLGAGFNPKLSGVENIFNAAAVLGLNAKETNAIIDEVTDFAELDDFIDSPVQTYSSGMYARLGFSVAVHLKPEILLIDEILSVGDHAFQNKCFGKMQQLKNEGMTILLVSHAHTRVIQLCEQALWMHKGKTVKAGPSKEVVKSYLSFLDDQEAKKLKKVNHPPEKKREAIQKKKSPSQLYGAIYNDFDKIGNLQVSFLVGNREVDALKVHDELIIQYSFDLKLPVKNLNVSLNFFRKEDGLLFNTISTLNGDVIKHITSGQVSCKVKIPDVNLNPGKYALVMPIHEGHSYLYRNVVKEFLVKGNNRMTSGIIDFNYEYQVHAIE
jgi:ABC-type polysaccharide/polyol phosphate transport system ATPase subunit